MTSEEVAPPLPDVGDLPEPETRRSRISISQTHRLGAELSFLLSAFRTRVRTGVLAIADQGIVSGVSFLTSVIVARSCTQGTFGVFVLGMSAVTLLLELQGALISTPYLVSAPPLSGVEARRYGGSALLHQVGLAIAASATLALGSSWVSRHETRWTLVVWALIMGAPFIMLRDFLRRHCFARLRLASALRLDAAVGVLQVAMLLILAATAWLSPSLALGAVGAASAAGAAGWLWLNRRDFSPGLRDCLADAKSNWALGRWVAASGIVWALAVQIYPWLLAALRGTAQAGVWGAALGIAAVLNVPLMAGQNVLAPRIARAKGATTALEFRQLVIRVSLGFAAMMLLAALPLLLFGGPLVHLLFGASYGGYGGVVSLLAGSVVFSAASFGTSRGLFCVERADLDFLVNVVVLALLVVLGPILVRGWGAVGAGLSLLATQATSCVLRAGALLSVTRSVAEDQLPV